MSSIKFLHVIRDGLKTWFNVFVTCVDVAEILLLSLALLFSLDIYDFHS